MITLNNNHISCTIMVPSVDVDNMIGLFGWKALSKMAPLCPVNLRTSRLETNSHMHKVISSDPERILVLSGAKRTLIN